MKDIKMEFTVAASEQTPRVLEHSRNQRRKVLSFSNRIKSTVATYTDGKQMYAAGVQVTADDVAKADFLLPVILLAIADNLSEASDAGQERPTFSFRMKPSETAVLCFEVSHIKTSSYDALSAAIKEVFQRSETGGEYVLDRYVTRFGNFLTDNELDTIELVKKLTHADK